MEFTAYEWLAIILVWFVLAGVIACFIGRFVSEFSSDYSDLKRIKSVVSFKCRAGEIWRRK